MPDNLRFLILDGYDRAAREDWSCELVTPAGELYATMLARVLPDAEAHIAFPADADGSIDGGLAAYDAMLWTGSSLTIYEEIPAVTRQIELAREGFRLGLPAFGSCWALQLAAVAGGGAARKNPNGREFGLARQITLTKAGRAHPIYANRTGAFDSFAAHFDEVAQLPPDSVALAGNAMSGIQAAEITHDKGSFFALQYHPEFDFRIVAGLARCRADGLIAEGKFTDRARLEEFITHCEALHKTPQNVAHRTALAANDDVLDIDVKQSEFFGWLKRTFPTAF